jgi:Holliday junction resolvase-like predicted endonuclease
VATTLRQRRGADAEQLASVFVEQLGWRVVARNVKVGHDEVDILALDPGPPRCLVNVEVRSLSVSMFGEPEERVDRGKVARLYRALHSVASGLESDEGLDHLPRRVDLVVVDRRSGLPVIRHLRALEPP